MSKWSQSKNSGIAQSLETATTVVSISTATAPVAGQVLTAIDSEHADWEAGGGGYTDEDAQDAVGGIITDTATIALTYDDLAPQITADVRVDSITYSLIQNVSASDRLLGRSTAGAGDIEELTVGAGLLLAAGDLSSTITQYTDELAQDAVGAALDDTGTIAFTYDDAGNTITADVKAGSVDVSLMYASATDVLFGRDSALAGAGEEITPAAARTMLSLNNVENTALSTWAGSANLTTFGPGSVSYSEIQNVSATDKVLGRSTAGAGTVEEIPCTSTGRAALNTASAAALATVAGVGTGDSPTFTGGTFTGSVAITGNLVVSGATITGGVIELEGNYVTLNDSYITDAAITSGFVKVIDPTTTTTGVAVGGFVAGVAAVSNPTISVTSSAGFAANDIVSISGSGANDGLFEVLTAALNVITVRGVGLTSNTEAWARSQLTTAVGSGNVTKVAVAVDRTGTDGILERAYGSTVPMTYSDYYYATGTDVAVVDGGTGLSSYTTGDVLYASGAGTLAGLADIAVGNVLLSGGVGVAPSYGKVALGSAISGTLPVGNGGTGLTSYTTGDILYASAAGVVSGLADAAVGNALLSGGAGVAPAYGKVALASAVSGTLPATNGGTGSVLYAVGDLLSADTTTTLSKVAAVAVGKVLRSKGVSTLPAWEQVVLTTDVTGTLPVANGGTGVTTVAAEEAALVAVRPNVNLLGRIFPAFGGSGFASAIGYGSVPSLSGTAAAYRLNSAPCDFISETTSTTINTTAGYPAQSASHYTLGICRTVDLTFGTHATLTISANARLGIGLVASGSVVTTSAPPNNCIYGRLDGGVSSTWYWVNQGAAANNQTDTGYIMLASSFYRARFAFSSTQTVTVSLWIWTNGAAGSPGSWAVVPGTTSTITTNLLSDTTTMSHTQQIQNIVGGVGTAVTFYVGEVTFYSTGLG